MSFLTPDKIYTKYGLEIKEKILPAFLKPGRKLSNGTGRAEYVTIHNTPDINEAKGTNDAEQYARATHNGNMKGVSVHFFIDDSDCWQLLKEDEMGYHATDGKNGKGNTRSIAIEIIMDGSGSKADKEAEERGAKLAAIELHKHGLSIDRLTTHNRFYKKKYCPAYILPHWNDFVKKVEKYLVEIKAFDEGYKTGDVNGDGKVTAADSRLTLRASVGAEKLTEKQKKAADVNGDGKVNSADAREILRMSVDGSANSAFQIKVTADALNIRKGAGTQYAITGVIKDQGVYTIVEEKDGWGKLKSGAGWISLNYTKKL